MAGNGMDGEPEAYRDDTLRGASISPRERLERIESILLVIDNKLDNKADRGEVLALELRLRDLEVRGSQNAQAAVRKAESLAMEREADIKEMRSRVELLSEQHSMLRSRVTWAFGVVAGLVFASDLAIRLLVR